MIAPILFTSSPATNQRNLLILDISRGGGKQCVPHLIGILKNIFAYIQHINEY